MEVRKDEVCDGFEVHEDLLKIVNETLPEETELYDLAELIQGFRRLYQNTHISLFCSRQRSASAILLKALNMTQSADFPSAPHPEAEQTGKEPQRRENPFSIPWQMIMSAPLSTRDGNI